MRIPLAADRDLLAGDLGEKSIEGQAGREALIASSSDRCRPTKRDLASAVGARRSMQYACSMQILTAGAPKLAQIGASAGELTPIIKEASVSLGAESWAQVSSGRIRRIDRTVCSGGVWVGELESSGMSFVVSKWEVHDASKNVLAAQPGLYVGKRSGVPE